MAAAIDLKPEAVRGLQQQESSTDELPLRHIILVTHALHSDTQKHDSKRSTRFNKCHKSTGWGGGEVPNGNIPYVLSKAKPKSRHSVQPLPEPWYEVNKQL